MAPGSLHSFHGFAGGAPLHLHLPHVVDPAAAACCYVEALELAGAPAELLEGFRICQPQAQPVAAPEQDTLALYRYRLRHCPRRRQALELECWRLYPGCSDWRRRCGPMPLAAFVEQFLPDQASLASTSRIVAASTSSRMTTLP